MDILKNIYLSFDYVINNDFLDKDIIIVSLLIKYLCFYVFINFDILNIILYFKNNINKNINKKNRKFLIFLNILIFINILFSNFLDLIPINIIKTIFLFKKLNLTPTSNINYTFFFSIISFIAINIISIKKNNILKFVLFFFKHPIKNKFMFIFNFIIEFTSFIMKPISLSLRLFGNIFSSEIIFNLISNTNILLNILLNFIWSVFHLLVLPLQAFIFITLVTIYVSQSLKH